MSDQAKQHLTAEQIAAISEVSQEVYNFVAGRFIHCIDDRVAAAAMDIALDARYAVQVRLIRVFESREKAKTK